MRKLRKKEMVVQVRDELNNRRFKLLLTELGKKVYEGHQLFTKECKDYFTECLEDFSEEELEKFRTKELSILKDRAQRSGAKK